MKICLIVPCYNESNRINHTEYINYLNNHNNVFIIFVDDGSQDLTHKILLKIVEVHTDKSKLMKLSRNCGKAEAVRSGMLEAAKMQKFDYIGFWYADLATPLVEIDKFELYICENPPVNIFIGSRIKRLGSQIIRKKTRHFLGRIFTTIIGYMTALPVYDTQCDSKIFKESEVVALFKNPFISEWFFDVELIFRFKKKYKQDVLNRIIEIPLQKWEDKNKSKLSIMDFLRAPIELLKIGIAYKGY